MTLEYHDPAKIKKKTKGSIPLSSLLDPHSLVHVFDTFLFKRSALGLYISHTFSRQIQSFVFKYKFLVATYVVKLCQFARMIKPIKVCCNLVRLTLTVHRKNVHLAPLSSYQTKIPPHLPTYYH